MSEEIKESIEDILKRLKLILINAEDANTEQGEKTYILIAIRTIEKLEKELGIVSGVTRSFLKERQEKERVKYFLSPPVVVIETEMLECGRRKSYCLHVRARKPKLCNRYLTGVCYAEYI